MTLSVSIMAHPKRKAWVEDLIVSIGFTLPVIWDEKSDVWDTGRRSLLSYRRGATHHLVLQDDAVIPPNIYETCERIIAHTPPDAPISLYLGRWRHRPRRYSMQAVVDAARSRQVSFAVFGGPWWGVGIIVPTADIEAIVAYGDEPGRHPNYDIRIAQFYKSKDIDCWYALPSVVDHREGPSIVGQRGHRRHAQWHEDDVSEIDWSRGAITEDEMNLSRPIPPLP